MAWEHIRSTYDTVARKYEARFRDELDARPLDRELLSAFAASVTDPVIEIGCGPGQIGAFVRGGGHRVIGVDLSTQMATLATGRLDAALTADMRRLPLQNGRAGGVLAFYSLIHLRRAELGPVLQEIHRVLRPGGQLLFSAHQGNGDIELDKFVGEPVPFAATFFQLDEVVTATEAADFTVTRTERREPYSDESTVRLYVEATKPTSKR